MKSFVVLLVLLGTGFLSQAQYDVELKIYHKLGMQDFQLNLTSENNLNNEFQVTRLEYYITRITVVHDGNQYISISDDTLALVDAADGPFTTIPLGNLTLTSVEEIRFHIGVFAPTNNADPSLQPMGHPLAPQSPSMHWGWTAGYRFVAMEGTCGTGFTQQFQLHGLDNANYFEARIPITQAYADNGKLTITLTGDYVQALRDIDISGGLVSHGSTGAALEALVNFNEYVFEESPFVSVEEAYAPVDWQIYPNPQTVGDVQIVLEELNNEITYDICNQLGQVVKSGSLMYGVNSVKMDVPGHYFVRLYMNDTAIDTKQLVIQ